MNTFKIALAFVALAAVAFADTYSFGGNDADTGAVVSRRGPYPEGGHLNRGSPRGSVGGLNPANWLQSVMQQVPKVEDISFKNLVELPLNQASLLVNAVVQNSYLKQWTGSLFTPNWNNVKFYLITGNGNVSVQLNSVSELKQFPQLSSGEVTILVTGLPSTPEDPSDAVATFIEAYRQRYQIGQHQEQNTQQQEQNSNSWESSTIGNLIVCNLGDELNSVERWMTLDIEDCGQHIGQALVDITDFVPYYNIHLIGHSQGAHAAGAAARYFSQKTSKQIRRLTGLDPNKLFTRVQHDQSELRRGVADFVDIIHTTSDGVGSKTNGDVDFYPNGQGSTVVGADDIIDASHKSLEYFAESVMPGGERNFMAVECNSMEAYEKHQCHGIRIPMGYNTPVDAKGDFVLRVNSNAPYGRNHRILKNNRSRSNVYA